MPKVPSKPLSTRQDPPNALQIEPVEGCSLSCQFCGVQGIRENKGGYKFMTLSMMDNIAFKLKYAMEVHGWNPRVEFAVHGEPTMHPQLVELVAMVGELKPRELIIVSNGTGFSKDPNDLVARLVEAGVTSICMDEYDGCDFVQKFREKYTGPVPVVSFDDEKLRGSTRKPPFIVIKKDVSHITTPYDKLNTHCGGGGPITTAENTAMNKRCAKPFRELTIRWDGNVALCCNDFRGVYKIGNVLAYPTLEDLWQDPAFYAARQMLLHNSRDFAPCQWCDAISPRVGLLPDKYGKTTLPKPDDATQEILDAAVAGPAYTQPVLRGWEVAGEPCLPKLYELDGLAVQKKDA